MWDLNNACDECWNCEWFRMNDYNDEGCCGDTEPCHEYMKMTIDEAIEYHIKAATQRAIADEEKGNYEKWNETKFMTKKESEQIIADNQQLAKWLTELKDLREENKILTSECDRLAKEKGELLQKVSGGDVLKICQLEEQLKNWKEEYANLNKISYDFYKELKEAKRLLKAAVEDFAKLDRENTKNKNCMMPEMDCADCPLSWDSVDERVEPCHSWQYANEALKLIES